MSRGRALIVTAMIAWATIVVAACGDDSSGLGAATEAGAESPGVDGSTIDGEAAITVPTDGGTSDGAAPDGSLAPRAPMPTFAPPPGTYNAAQSLVIRSSVPDASVYFTTDGTTPTTASPTHAAPLYAGCGTFVLRAIATGAGLAASAVAEGRYTFHHQSYGMSPVTITPAGGTYVHSVSVSVSSSTVPSTTCYTTDGSTPACVVTCVGAPARTCVNGAKTSTPGSSIILDAPDGGVTVVVKAIACDDRAEHTEIATATYVLTAADGG